MPLLPGLIVTFADDRSMVAIVTLAVSTVAVPVPELESKCTLVVVAGMARVDAVPPEDNDQWVAASDQLPVPPTQ